VLQQVRAQVPRRLTAPAGDGALQRHEHQRREAQQHDLVLHAVQGGQHARAPLLGELVMDAVEDMLERQAHDDEERQAQRQNHRG
jgi:hypothetical protein